MCKSAGSVPWVMKETFNLTRVNLELCSFFLLPKWLRNKRTGWQNKYFLLNSILKIFDPPWLVRVRSIFSPRNKTNLSTFLQLYNQLLESLHRTSAHKSVFFPFCTWLTLSHPSNTRVAFLGKPYLNPSNSLL